MRVRGRVGSAGGAGVCLGGPWKGRKARERRAGAGGRAALAPKVDWESLQAGGAAHARIFVPVGEASPSAARGQAPHSRPACLPACCRSSPWGWKFRGLPGKGRPAWVGRGNFAAFF